MQAFKQWVLKEAARKTCDAKEIKELQELMGEGVWADNLTVRATVEVLQIAVRVHLGGEGWQWVPAPSSTPAELEALSLEAGRFSLLEPW